MGTNYYAKPKRPCTMQVVDPSGCVLESKNTYAHPSLFRWKDGVEPESCDCLDERNGLHIMKCSYGWKVTFQSAPEVGVSTVGDIFELFATGKYDLVDEYGNVKEQPEETIKTEIASRMDCLNSAVPGHSYLDPDGNVFVIGDFS